MSESIRAVAPSPDDLSTPAVTNGREPPYDGKPCPMCPIEVRNLHAVAHNFLSRWDAWRQHGGDFGKVVEKARDLERAVELARPLADAHFANRMHSHPAAPEADRTGPAGATAEPSGSEA